ncbi:MAG TPA: AtpZ/AtpI family protein [Anaerolineales bacterium]
MSLSNQPPEAPKKPQPAPNLALYTVGGQVGCATLIIVFAALFIGIGLDKLLGTKPVFTLILVLGSAPLSLFLTYQLAMRAVKSATPKEPVGSQTKPVEEEENRE